MTRIAYPATTPQINFIRSLLTQREVNGERQVMIEDALEAGISKSEASDLIGELKALPWLPKPDKALSTGFIGEVGAKLADIAGEIIVYQSYTNERYGTTSKLVVVKTEDGKLVKTFGTGSSLWGHEVGDKVLVSGTIKAHDTYRGDDQTVLTRTKLEVTESVEKPRHLGDLWHEEDETPLNYNSRTFGPPAGFVGSTEPTAPRSGYRASEVDDILSHFTK